MDANREEENAPARVRGVCARESPYFESLVYKEKKPHEGKEGRGKGKGRGFKLTTTSV